MRYSCFLILAFLLACGSRNEESGSTGNTTSISYEEKTFRLESRGGCEVDTLPCAAYVINYPQFNGLHEAVTDSIARYIDIIADLGNPELEEPDFEEAGKEFIKGFESFRDEVSDSPLGWTFTADVQVQLLTDTLLSLVAEQEYFTGGAHGGHGTYFANLDPRTGSRVVLDDVMKPGYKEPLRSVAESIFRQTNQLSDTSSFAEIGLEFPNDRFFLNDNYGFNDVGILFVFNVYEIGPYALGSQEVLVPYSQIRELLQ